MNAKKVYGYIKEMIKPTEVAKFYLGEEDRVSGSSLVYYSPLRKKERTPSFFFNDKKGIHDFRNR